MVNFIKIAMKHLVKNGRKIKGFVYQDSQQNWWFAFGRPSQDNYIAFACRSKEHGIASVEMKSF
jgi:hypothetical protein